MDEGDLFWGESNLISKERIPPARPADLKLKLKNEVSTESDEEDPLKRSLKKLHKYEAPTANLTKSDLINDMKEQDKKVQKKIGLNLSEAPAM